jgi:hypothetical protein
MSIPLLATNTTQICRVVKALYDAAPGYTYLQNFLSYTSSAGLAGTANALASNFTSQSNAQLSATICTNLGLTGVAYSAGVDYLTAQFNASTSAKRGEVILAAMNALSGLSSDATFGAAATTFNAAIARSEAYSTNSDNTSTEIAVLQAADESGSSSTEFAFTTTQGETKTGTSGNDLFTGSTTAGSGTLNSGDVANGGLGTDTLTILAGGSAATLSLSSIENVNVRLLADQTFDVLTWSGTTSVDVTSDSTANNALTINNAALSTRFTLSKYGSADINYLDSTTSDTALIGASGTFWSTSTNISTIDTGSAGNVNLILGGTNNLRLEGAAVNYTITGSGSANVRVDAASGVNAAGYSGNIALTASAASNLTATLGSGNDRIVFGATFNGLDSVNGGDGTDVLTASVAGSVGLSNIQNVETAIFNATGSTVSMTMSGASFSEIRFNEATAGVDLTMRDNLAAGTHMKFVGSAALGDISIDYVSGAAALISFAGSGGDISLVSSLTVTDAGSFTLNVDSKSGDVTLISAITLDTETTTATFSQSAGSITTSNAAVVNLAGARTLNVTNAASGTFTNAGVLRGSALTDINITQSGTGETAIVLMSSTDVMTLNSGSTTIDIVGTGSGTIRGFGLNASQGSAGTNQTTTLTIDLRDNANFGDGTDQFSFIGSAIFNMSATLGASAAVNMSAINLGVSGTVGDVSLTLGASAGWYNSVLNADVLGNIVISAAQGASAHFADASAGVAGSINLSGSGKSIIVLDTTSGINGITVSGGSSNVTVSSTTGGIGNITLTGSGSTITNVNGDVGSILIAGSGTTVVDVGSANNVGNVDVTSHGGAATIDLSSAMNGVTVNLGASGTDILYVGVTGNTVYFESGSGTDRVVFTGSANDNASIYNFDLTSATDVIGFASAGFQLGMASAYLADNTIDVLLVSGGSALAIGAATAGTDVVIIRTSTFTDTLDMLSAIASAGNLTLTISTAVTAGLDLIIAWMDSNSNTNITLVNTTAAGQGALFSSRAIAVGQDYETLAILYGVNIASFTSSFTDKFDVM